MPRKKMIKRNVKSQAKVKNNFSQAALGKVEKEFFSIPSKIVKNATKQLTTQQKRSDKLSKTLAKTTSFVSKLEKKLLDLKKSKKPVKKSVLNSVMKQHQAVVKQQTALAKEHKEATANLQPLKSFHAKFHFLSKQLVQLEKDWTSSQKTQSAEKKPSNVLKEKADKKRSFKSNDANVVTHPTLTPTTPDADDRMDMEETELDERSGS